MITAPTCPACGKNPPFRGERTPGSGYYQGSYCAECLEDVIRGKKVRPKGGWSRGNADAREILPKDRVEILTPKYGPRGTFCDECSVGTRQDPIPHTKKRVAEFAIKIGKHGYHTLCRGCALRFAEDFFNQLEVLTGIKNDE